MVFLQLLRGWSIESSFFATVDLNLPEPQDFVNDARDLAFANINLFWAALVGVTLVVLVLKSFWKN
jgi:hypothetical protein